MPTREIASLAETPVIDARAVILRAGARELRTALLLPRDRQPGAGPLPVLLDHENRLADDFRAKANAQVFLIDANRFLRYHGGIDDDPTGERARQKVPSAPWLETALDEVLAGERPKVDWTNPAGLPIKRVPKPK